MKNQITTEKINHDQQNQLLSIEPFNPSMLTIIEQRAQQLMTFINTINDNNFF